ncbi:MAG: hypothetical protein AAF959_28910, partial [Cyanobacteria bacterium P01_D01_bin.56]
MATGIFAIQDNGQLIEMTEAAYDSEDVFQALLEQYPNLLAGDQIDNSSPRRWLLVQREMRVPDIENGAGRWSVDHLFLDQDAIPTLVEVKRSSDTRIRREVVGQMLDYAANAVSYWPVEQIRDCYETNCDTQGVDADQQLVDLLGTESDDLNWSLAAASNHLNHQTRYPINPPAAGLHPPLGCHSWFHSNHEFVQRAN